MRYSNNHVIITNRGKSPEGLVNRLNEVFKGRGQVSIEARHNRVEPRFSKNINISHPMHEEGVGVTVGHRAFNFSKLGFVKLALLGKGRAADAVLHARRNTSLPGRVPKFIDKVRKSMEAAEKRHLSAERTLKMGKIPVAREIKLRRTSNMAKKRMLNRYDMMNRIRNTVNYDNRMRVF